MIPWTRLAVARAQDGVELKLMRRGSEVSIMLGGDELMNSRRGGSETALGEIGCGGLRSAPAPHVLIGGLGLGFTLRAALGVLGPKATVTVVELVPEVVEWARSELADVFQASLSDHRVRLVVGDVGALIRSGDGTYDAILLDVDNGPGGLVRAANDRLYDEGGLRSAREALKPTGVLAVWSAAHDPAFGRRLARAGFDTTEHGVRSARASGARHLIWIAKRPPPTGAPDARS